METSMVGIVGSGPAGLTAAIYVARGGLTPLVVTGHPPGGALITTTDIENFPGFPHGITGPDLMDNMRRQAERLGAQMKGGVVESVDFHERPFRLHLGSETLVVPAVIVAVGAATRWLGLDNETRLRGRGVSTCATCDGFFFRDREIVVVGGGDSAMEESVFLSRLASQVTVLVRGEKLRASHAMATRARALSNIRFIYQVHVHDILGDERVTGVRIKHAVGGGIEDLPCQAVFVAIGQVPNTGFLNGQVALDQDGYIQQHDCTQTSVPGVFVAGDVYDRRYKQAVTAAGSGCRAALDCIEYLETGSLLCQ
ncbi:MAG TPA: thioredoxin-disulfide reductase [Candidatus Xenobia bacterium]|jgi:thioredoxin reductase (NADPH)